MQEQVRESEQMYNKSDGEECVKIKLGRMLEGFSVL